MENMVKCKCCGEIFPYDDLQLSEEHGCYESDYGVYFEFDSHTYYDVTNTICPYCGSDEYEAGYVCNECNQFVKYVEDEIYGICTECVCKYTEEEYNLKYPIDECEV